MRNPPPPSRLLPVPGMPSQHPHRQPLRPFPPPPGQTRNTMPLQGQGDKTSGEPMGDLGCNRNYATWHKALGRMAWLVCIDARITGSPVTADRCEGPSAGLSSVIP